MSEVLKERNEMDPAYMWDLSTLFHSDDEFEDALEAVKASVEDLAKYEGTLTNASAITTFLDAEYGVMLKVTDIFSYASLRKVEDTRDTKAQGMYAKAYSEVVKMQTICSYAEPEILSNDEETLHAIIQDDCLKDYKIYLENLVRAKAHTLSNKEEAIMASFAEALNTPEEAMGALLYADMLFKDALDSEGKAHEVTAANYILLQTSQDRVLRKNAFDSFYESFAHNNNTLTAVYAGNVKTCTTEARLRHYDSSRQMRMASDNIPETVYDNLIETVHARMDLMYRYVRLRKRLLKLDEVHYYDLYAPLTSGITDTYSYEEAQRMVLDAVAPLGKEYVERVQEAFDQKWIDVYPNKGKETGAFSAGTYDSNPVIKMNYTGTLDSVSTLAHEMGHSQHTWLTNHTQPFQYSEYTMFVAEVASTVNENLLIDQLLEKETDPKRRLALLNQYLEGFKGTVYRQTMFAEFEKEAHAMCERGEALTTQSLNDLYLNLIKLYFGEDMVVDDAVKYEWSRIPHFYNMFYVYVYATGYSSACAISEKILHKEENALKNYLEFLSMGSSQYPLDELKHAGVDLTTPEPINIALDKFERVIEEAEKIADELGF